MGQVIDLRKWVAWRDIKKLLSAGRLSVPRPELDIPVHRPTTDAAIALAYALSANHSPRCWAVWVSKLPARVTGDEPK